jgi:hypothetical protein
MSFALTTEQARNRTKTVTRRNGWLFLRPGDVVQQVVKGMGLKKGEKVERIHLIEIISTWPEILNQIDHEDCAKEGFPALTPGEFIAMYCRHNGGGDRQFVNRIEFKYLD